MKRFRLIISATILCLVMLTAVACNSAVASITKAQSLAAQNATTVQCIAIVSDGDTVVYRYSKEIVVMSDSMSVTTAEATLDSSFELKENTKSEEMPLNRNALKSLNLTESVVTEVVSEQSSVSLKVLKENIGTVLGIDIGATSDAVVTVQLDGDRLNSISMTFTTATKSVEIQYVYSY